MVALSLLGEPPFEAWGRIDLSEDELYQEHILDHYEEPYHRGRLPAATHSHEDDNPLCGDFVHMDLEVDAGGRIRQAWFDGDGCCISQSAASMLTQHVEGRSLDEVRHLTAGDMLALFGARLTPNRQKCCLLPWRVLQAAVFSPAQSQTGESSTGREIGRERPR